MRKFKIIGMCLTLFVLCNCTSEEQLAWSDAKKKDTEEAYLNYVNKYPKAENVEVALKIAEEKAWEITIMERSISSLEFFITSYPKSHYLAEAHQILDEVRYTISRDVLEACLRDAIYKSMPIERGTEMKLIIKKIGKYDKNAGYLLVDASAEIPYGPSIYAIVPDHFEVYTDGEGNWEAEYFE